MHRTAVWQRALAREPQYTEAAPGDDQRTGAWRADEMPDSPSPRRSRPGGARPIPAKAALGAVAVAALLLAAAIGGFAYHASFNGKLYDNVFVADQNVGGMTTEAAHATLSQALAPYLVGAITLTANGRQWTPQLTDLGMTIDLDRTIAEAYRVGRAGGPVGQLWRGFQMRHGARTFVPLSVRVDDGALNTYLDGLQAQLGTPPHDATVAVKGGEIVVTPGTDGTKLDRDTLRSQLLDSAAHLRGTTFPLPVTLAAPTITTDMAAHAKTRAEALVSAPLSLTFNDKHWDLTRDDRVGAVRFAPDLTPSLDTIALTPKINAIAAEINQEPKNAVIGWDGQLVVRAPAKDGRRLNVDALMAQLRGWTGDPSAIPLTVEVQKPRITDDVGALGITTRIARGISNFSGSDAARAKNIEVAAGYLDDTVVAPGETFSFLDAIGEISVARGYKDGFVILAEQTVPGIGGGVCQVATTMFRAAMYSGLPIEERNPHAYLVRYYEQGGYPVGLDAAVFSPGVDLKFRNETDKYMLVKTGIDGGNLYISIYGPDLGYKVDIGNPVIKNKKDAPEDEYQIDPTLPPGTRKQVEFAKPGEDVSITRTVRSADGKIVRQATFDTHYQAWPNKFLIAKDVRAPKVGKATTAPNTPAAGQKPTPQPTKPPTAGAQATLPPKQTSVPTKKP